MDCPTGWDGGQIPSWDAENMQENLGEKKQFGRKGSSIGATFPRDRRSRAGPQQCSTRRNLGRVSHPLRSTQEVRRCLLVCLSWEDTRLFTIARKWEGTAYQYGDGQRNWSRCSGELCHQRTRTSGRWVWWESIPSESERQIPCCCLHMKPRFVTLWLSSIYIYYLFTIYISSIYISNI